MAKKRIPACWLLLMTAIFTASTLMGTGQAQARYQNTVTWNTVVDDTIHHDQVTSDCLDNVSNPPVTILLSEMTLDPSDPMEVVFYLYSGVPVIGPLNWTADRPDFVDVTMSVGSGENLKILQTGDNVEIPEGANGLKVTMTLKPTDKALGQSHDAMDVNIAVAWSDCLGGTFLTFLPALDLGGSIPLIPGVVDPEETIPETQPTEPAQPEETQPTEPAQPEETQPTEPAQPEETQPTEPTQPEETQPTEPAQTEQTQPTEPAQTEETQSTEPAQTQETQPVAESQSDGEAQPSETESDSQIRTFQTAARHRTLASEAAAERNQQTLLENGDTMPTDEGDGSTGNTGNSGDNSNTGNTDDSGNTGNTGNTGDNSDSGNTGNTGDNNNSGEKTEEETPAETEPAPQEPDASIETLLTFKSDNVLPVKIYTIGPMSSVGLGMGMREKADTEGMELIEFPKYLRYSLDGGQSYYMIYNPAPIALAPTNGEAQFVLLDWSRVKLASPQVNLAIACYEEGKTVAADIFVTTAQEQYYVTAASRILDTSAPLEITIPQSWEGYVLEYEVQMLTSPRLADGTYGPQTYETVMQSGEEPTEKEPAEEDPAGEESTGEESTEEESAEEKPAAAGLIVEATDTGNLQIRLGENLPKAGCYRINMYWKSGETVAEQAQVIFYINYSAKKETLKTGGAEQ